jgi:hypothetical protein
MTPKCMIRALASRKILSNTLASRIAFGGLTLVSGLIMILGIGRLPEMDLTEAQVLFGSLTIMSFAGICLMLALLIRLSFRAPGARS